MQMIRPVRSSPPSTHGRGRGRGWARVTVNASGSRRAGQPIRRNESYVYAASSRDRCARRRCAARPCPSSDAASSSGACPDRDPLIVVSADPM
ncbi:hypothetical protein Aph02nite_78210 [Actinoplanes philippinensis]|nr:hypothetical protein Aph02nite_78210 [Actinoplanes philippinensis]